MGCSQQARALAGGKHRSQLPWGKMRHPPTHCASPQGWEIHANLKGMLGDAESRRGTGRTALLELCGSHRSPFPRRAEDLQASPPPLAPNPLLCPLFVCLPLRSCCRIASHIFQPAEQGWELLSTKRLSNSETGQGDPRCLLPRWAANPHVRNCTFWRNTRNNPFTGGSQQVHTTESMGKRKHQPPVPRATGGR